VKRHFVPEPINIAVDRYSASTITGHLSSKSVAPGRHVVSLPVKLRVFRGKLDAQRRMLSDGKAAEARSTLCHEEDRVLTATFDVLSPGAGDGITLVKDPSLRRQLRTCLPDFRLEVRKPDSGQPAYCSLKVSVHPLPVGVAFDVYLRIRDREHLVSSFRTPAGKATSYSMGFEFDQPLADTVDVIFRTNKALAQETVDIMEIWDGELVFENVPVVKK
jgi:hypothetical protein